MTDDDRDPQRPAELELGIGAVDLRTGAVSLHDGRRERLTTRELALLSHLAARPRAVVSHDALLTEVWGHHRDSLSRAPMHAVRRLRAKIEIDPSAPTHIITVHGDGYRFVPLGAEDDAAQRTEPPRPADTPDAELDTCALYLDRQQLARPDGQIETLTAAEAGVLRCLLDGAGRPVARSQLLKAVWGRRASATRAVDNVLYRLRRRIERDPARPRHLTTVRGAGYRLVLGQEDPPPEAPALPPTRPLIGRAADASAVIDALRGARLVTLVGAGGVGKTTTALHIAHRIAADGDVRWADLSAATTAAGLLTPVVEALRCAPPPHLPTDAATDWVGERLARQPPALLVLDNFEQLRALAGQTVGRWLRAAPQLRLLITSRAPLELAEERIHRLEPLPPDDAVALFVARRGGAREAGVAALVERLDRLPLAIELAAARCVVLTPAQLLERLDERFRLLRRAGEAGEAGDPDARRHASLRRTIAWSWSLLDPDARSVLAQLSTFVGRFSFEAVERVVRTRAWALDVVQRLVDASMVTVDCSGPAPRFRLLESVRAFAAEELAAGADADGAHLRHARHYADEAERLARDHLFIGTEGAFAALFDALDDIQAAFERTLDRRPTLAADLLLPVGLAMCRRGMAPVVERSLAALKRALPRSAAKHRAHVEVIGAFVAWIRADAAGARDALSRAEALMAGRDLPAVAARMHYLRGMFAVHDETGEPARPHMQAALDCARRSGDEALMVAMGGNLGAGYVQEGDLPAALTCFRDALRLADARGYSYMSGVFHAQIGGAELQRGRDRAAIFHFERALLSGVAHHEQGLADWRAGLAVARWMDGDAAAETDLRAAIAALDHPGLADFRARARSRYGRLLLLAGRPADAEAPLRGSLSATRAPGQRAITTAFLSACLSATGRAAEARACLDDAARLAAHDPLARAVVDLLRSTAPPPSFGDGPWAERSLAYRQALRLVGARDGC